MHIPRTINQSETLHGLFRGHIFDNKVELTVTETPATKHKLPCSKMYKHQKYKVVNLQNLKEFN